MPEVLDDTSSARYPPGANDASRVGPSQGGRTGLSTGLTHPKLAGSIHRPGSCPGWPGWLMPRVAGLAHAHGPVGASRLGGAGCGVTQASGTPWRRAGPLWCRGAAGPATTLCAVPGDAATAGWPLLS